MNRNKTLESQIWLRLLAHGLITHTDNPHIIDEKGGNVSFVISIQDRMWMGCASYIESHIFNISTYVASDIQILYPVRKEWDTRIFDYIWVKDDV